MRRELAPQWWRPAAALTALTGVAFLYLEVRLAQEGEKIIVPIAVICVLDLLLAAAMAAVRRAWLVLPALLLLVVGFIGDFTHQAGVISHPAVTEHFVFAVVATVVQLAAIVVVARCAAATIRGPPGRVAVLTPL